jgi:hypothetical protein
MINLMVGRGMNRNHFLVLFVFSLLWTAPASAQLPNSFNGWQTKTTQAVTPPRAEQFAEGDAAVIREYGVLHGEHRVYEKNGASLPVTLWTMKDATGAYGLYSFYRDPGTATLQDGYRVAIWPNRVIVQRGSYLADAQGTSLSLGDAKLLMSGIPAATRGKDEGSVPLLPAYLPEENMVAQSAKFVIGPTAFAKLINALPPSAMGFEQGAEAVIADYKTGNSTTRFLMASYATPQMAAKKLRQLQQLPAVAHPAAGTEIALERKGPLVSAVIGSPSPAVAQALLGAVQYETQITWNERMLTRRDNIGHLMMNVFMLAGFVVLFAAVAGLSFGGIRLLAKKFLPFPIFDRPAQMEIIRLNLTDS